MPSISWESIEYSCGLSISGYFSEGNVRLTNISNNDHIDFRAVPMIKAVDYRSSNGIMPTIIPDAIMGLSPSSGSFKWNRMVHGRMDTNPVEHIMNQLPRRFPKLISFIFNPSASSPPAQGWLEGKDSWERRLFMTSDSFMVIGAPPLERLASPLVVFKNPCGHEQWCVEVGAVRCRGLAHLKHSGNLVAQIDTGTSVTSLGPHLWDQLADNLIRHPNNCEVTSIDGLNRSIICECHGGLFSLWRRPLPSICFEIVARNARTYRYCLDAAEILTPVKGSHQSRCRYNVSRMSSGKYDIILGLNFMRTYTPVLNIETADVGFASNGLHQLVELV
eukprot:GHVH01017171.1.p1 GENE.GHVH01017171.1~~GHVH01017171.1.p1  ORF type:complete len:333 (-),score=36.16 GHVH01017171.1:159-1157(-)